MANYTFAESLLQVSRAQFSLVPITRHTPVSSLNQYSVTFGPVSRFWAVRLEIVVQARADWQAMTALLDLLDGGFNKVRLFDSTHDTPLGANTQTAVAVKTAALAGATSLTLKSLDASVAAALASGDYLGIGENLHRISATANTDSNGEATISLRPELRQGVAANDPVNLAKPTGLFRPVGGTPYPVIAGDRLSDPLTLEFFEDPDFGA